MLAFLLVLAIFAYWSIIGFSLVSGLNSRKNILRNALLSPVVGSAATVLVVLWVSIAGIPVKRAALALTVVLLAGAILWLAKSRPIVPLRRLVPFLLVILLALFLTGYPLLKFGLDWISFGNDDMANYTLGATYFSNYGFFPLPPADRIIENSDPSAFIWYYLVGGGERPGIELANAWVMSLTHLSSHQTYMPLMLALHLVLISAAGALLLECRRYRVISLLTCMWLGCSSLNTLGTLYQLMGQVFGLPLLIGACVIICSGFAQRSRGLAIGRIALSAILFAALLIVYPELLPFLFVTAFLYHTLLLMRKQESWGALVRFAACAGTGAILLVNVACVGIVTDTVRRLGGTFRAVSATGSLFPFYLIPSGLAHLWGFYPIGKVLAGHLLDLGIICGLLALLGTVAGAIRLAWRGHLVAIMCLVLTVIGIRAFATRADFVLYKVAMYVQPFLLGVAILSWFEFIGWCNRKGLPDRLRQIAFLGPLALLIGVGLPAQAYYTERSLGAVGGGFVEIPRASSAHLISQLISLSHEPRPRAILTDTENVVTAKVESNYMMPASFFPLTTEEFVGRFVEQKVRSRISERFLNWMMPGLSSRLSYVYQERSKRTRHIEFDTRGDLPSRDRFEVRVETDDSELARYSVLQSTSEGIVNRRSIPRNGDSILRRVALAQAHNYLVFVGSEFGVPFYTTLENRFAGRVSLYQPENDYFYPKTTMVSMGRDTLLRVLSPSREFRLALEYTASLNADGQCRIPPINVVGTERRFLAVEGRGSARLFSPVIQPESIGGGEYFLLDMGTHGFRFPNRRAGLMALYGRDIPLDPRVIVGFGRDISALSEEEYQDLAAPSHVQAFPTDLTNRSLEYSGIYEDGWVAESSYLKLRQSKEGSPLVVRVAVPVIGGKAASSRLVLKVDGSEVARKSLSTKTAEIQVPGSRIGKHRIELMFDGATGLPGTDGRPVSARIQFVGFRDN